MAEIRIAGYINKEKTQQLQRHVPAGKLGEFVLVDLKSCKHQPIDEKKAHELFANLAIVEKYWTSRFFK